MANEERRSAIPVAATPCWRVEEFVVAQECSRCSSFQAKTIPECHPTGFIEKINCATSKRGEFKSKQPAEHKRVKELLTPLSKKCWGRNTFPTPSSAQHFHFRNSQA